MKLPLFPLPIFLLPQGVTRLRIFEPRYLRMVGIASQGNGFAILLNTGNQPKTAVNWASWVEIIDFTQGSDGMLNIDVRCKALVDVQSITIEEDNLHFGEVSEKEHWPDIHYDDTTILLSESLTDLFERNRSLKALYRDEHFDNPNWVVARWLELLPVELSVKSTFSQPQSFENAKTLLKEIILKSK